MKENKTMFLECAAYSDPGKVRRNNEDNCYINNQWRRLENEYFTGTGHERDDLTAVVCDGMGGSEKGERASLIAVNTVAQYYEKEKKIDFLPIIQSANDQICEEIKAKGHSMGTTFTGIQIKDGKLIVVNVGDSRVYRLRDRKLEQLSEDHSIVQRMIKMGLITKEEAKNHPQKHCITQYLGIQEEDMVIEPQLKTDMAIEMGDRYLLCSDGLTDMVSDAEIETILEKEKSVKEAAEELLNTALEHGGVDNVTVILVEVQQEEERKR